MVRIRFAGEGAGLAQSQPDGSGSPKSTFIVARFGEKVKFFKNLLPSGPEGAIIGDVNSRFRALNEVNAI